MNDFKWKIGGLYKSTGLVNIIFGESDVEIFKYYILERATLLKNMFVLPLKKEEIFMTINYYHFSASSFTPVNNHNYTVVKCLHKDKIGFLYYQEHVSIGAKLLV